MGGELESKCGNSMKEIIHAHRNTRCFVHVFGRVSETNKPNLHSGRKQCYSIDVRSTKGCNMRHWFRKVNSEFNDFLWVTAAAITRIVAPDNFNLEGFRHIHQGLLSIMSLEMLYIQIPSPRLEVSQCTGFCGTFWRCRRCTPEFDRSSFNEIA